jgi:hypothetical protein
MVFCAGDCGGCSSGAEVYGGYGVWRFVVSNGCGVSLSQLTSKTGSPAANVTGIEYGAGVVLSYGNFAGCATQSQIDWRERIWGFVISDVT